VGEARNRQGRAPTKVGQVLAPGDVVYVDASPTRMPQNTGCARCRKSGAMVVMDP